MNTQKIETNVWHALLFFFAHKLWRTFASSQWHISVPHRSNICQYIRTLVFAAAALVFYAATVLVLLAVTVYYPSVYFGWPFWLTILLYGAGALVLIAIVIFAILGTEKLSDWNKERLRQVQRLEGVIEGTTNRPSLYSLFKQYVGTQSEGFCGTIEFVAPAAATYQERRVQVASFEVATAVRLAGADRTLPLPELFIGEVASASDSSVSSPVAELEQLPVSNISTERFKYTPVWWKVAGLLFLAYGAFSLETTLYNESAIISPVWEGDCMAKEWTAKGDNAVQLTLACMGSEETVLKDRTTLLSIANGTKKPHCFKSQEGEFYCAEQDMKRKN